MKRTKDIIIATTNIFLDNILEQRFPYHKPKKENCSMNIPRLILDAAHSRMLPSDPRIPGSLDCSPRPSTLCHLYRSKRNMLLLL
jgi:hypothetical protein